MSPRITTAIAVKEHVSVQPGPIETAVGKQCAGWNILQEKSHVLTIPLQMKSGNVSARLCHAVNDASDPVQSQIVVTRRGARALKKERTVEREVAIFPTSAAAVAEPGTTAPSANAGPSISPEITFVINTQGPGPFSPPADARQQRGLPLVATRVSTHKSGADSDSDVLQTPKGMLASLTPPRKKLRLSESQDVNPADSSQSALADASDTEGSPSPSEYHANEPVAEFSPRCQLVSPSRKRKLDRMVTADETAKEEEEEDDE
ncbi:hypothetical protein DFH09DRAFT_1422350 [Mycena vulgaris]|nr:hypothetical protein DFH09DRAFT_1422350 [Mycena vulgaris]